MRLLFTCRPSLGHIQPLLPLARAAAAAGHEVIFGTAVGAWGRLTAEGFETVRIGDPTDPGLVSLQSGVDAPPLEKFRLVAFTRFFADSELKRRLVDLEPLVQSLRPDIIVHEIAELAALLAAAAADIPLVTVGFGPLLDPAVASAAADVVTPLWVERGLRPPRWAGLYRDLYLDPCPSSLQIHEVSELPRVEPMKIQNGEPGAPIGLLTRRSTRQHRPKAYFS
jgi:UDP:flavonoid glycosyltransferase YjiC (YdhE family)